MADDRLRNLHGRLAVGKGDRSEGWIADWRDVNEEHAAAGERPRVFGRQLHEEIVRMLAVDDRLAERGLAGLKELGILPVADRGRLEAEHRAELNRAAPCRALGGEHPPVRGEVLVVSARTGLAERVECGVGVRHQMPRARVSHQHLHRRGRGIRGRSGGLLHEKYLGRSIAVVMMLRHHSSKHPRCNQHPGIVARLRIASERL